MPAHVTPSSACPSSTAPNSAASTGSSDSSTATVRADVRRTAAVSAATATTTPSRAEIPSTGASAQRRAGAADAANGDMSTAATPRASARPSNPRSARPTRSARSAYAPSATAASRPQATPHTSRSPVGRTMSTTPTKPATGTSAAFGRRMPRIATANGPRNSSVSAMPSGRRSRARYRKAFMLAIATPKHPIAAHRPALRPRRRGRTIASATTPAIAKRRPLTPAGEMWSNRPCARIADSWTPSEATRTRPAAAAAVSARRRAVTRHAPGARWHKVMRGSWELQITTTIRLKWAHGCRGCTHGGTVAISERDASG